MAGRLQNKVAVITGAASGMGLATAEKFIAEGASVIVADVARERGEAVAQRLGKNARFSFCDVMSEDSIAAAVALAVETFGGLDIMYNNAGVQGSVSSIEHMPAEDWDFTLAIMTRGPMLGIKHAAPAIRARGGGTILVTASAAGMRGGMGVAAYAVAKAAAIQLVRMAAGEFGPDNIRVNSICPGFIATPIFGRAMNESDEVSERMAAQLQQRLASVQPLPRAGLPQDIAEAAVYLASDAGSFVSGIELVVDGGLLVQPRINTRDPAANPIAQMLMEVRDMAKG